MSTTDAAPLYVEHQIDCGENTDATCHSPEYVTALFRGEHIDYSHRPLKAGEPALTYFAWIQCLHSLSAAWDLVAGGWQQHITAHQGDILFLPLTVCQWLLANRPTDWRPFTVAPGSLGLPTSRAGELAAVSLANLVLGGGGPSVATDGGTGLQYISAVMTGIWGIDSRGHAFFTADVDMGRDEPAYMTVDANNRAFLTQ